MAIQEHSLGQLYVATVRARRCPPHWVDIVQMHEPWRRGRATILYCGFGRALVIGRWKRTIYEDIDKDFADERWLAPQWLDSVTPDEISTWDDLSDPSEQEKGEAI